MTTSHIVEAGECLACGHIQPFAVFRCVEEGLPSVGICAACRRLAQANRGPCSEKRGCGCEAFGMAVTPGYSGFDPNSTPETSPETEKPK